MHATLAIYEKKVTSVYYLQNPLPADSFSKYKTKVIPNKVCIIRLYTIKYCIFRVIWLIFSRNFTSIYTCKISAEDESNDSKYTVFNCVKSNYAHFIRNYFSLIYYLPSSFSSFIIALFNFASSMPRLLRVISWSCFSLLKDFESTILVSSSRAFTLLFKSFKEAKHFATTTKRTTITTQKTNNSTFMTKCERYLLVLGSFSFFSIVSTVKNSQNIFLNFSTALCSKPTK